VPEVHQEDGNDLSRSCNEYRAALHRMIQVAHRMVKVLDSLDVTRPSQELFETNEAVEAAIENVLAADDKLIADLPLQCRDC